MKRLVGLNRMLAMWAAAAFAAPLVLFASIGMHARLWADDYCYEAALQAQGFWMGQWAFYRDTSDRYSVIPLAGAGAALGEWFVRAWSLIAILTMTIAVIFLLKSLFDMRIAEVWESSVAAIACAGVFFVLWQAPNRFQILYWRTGMLTYWMPLVWLAGLLAVLFSIRRVTWGAAIGLAFAAFIAGGFSETTTALQAGALGLGMMVSLLRRDGTATRAWAAALIGTLLAMAALFLSPSNALRMTHMPQSASVTTLITLSLRFAFDFTRDTLSSQPMPTLVWALLCGAFGVGWGAAPNAVSAFAAVRRLVASLVIGYGLLACSIAPSVYIQVAYPEPRALIAARVVLTFALGCAAWFGGAALAAWTRDRSRVRSVLLVGAMAVLLLVSIYPLRARTVLFTEERWLHTRAAEWDVRHAKIMALREAGNYEIVIPALDSISGLMELTPDAATWPNTCIAAYYRLNSITASP